MMRLLLALLLLALVLPGPSSAELAPGLSLSPSSSTAYRGSTFTLAIMVDCGSNADGAQTTTNFNTTYLEVVSVSPDTSKFPNTLANSFNNGTGTVRYDAGAPLACHSDGNCPSGVVRIATITFRAKANTSPNTLVGISGRITWSGVYIFDGVGTGGTITITSPPTSTPTYTPTNTPRPSVTPTPRGTATPMGAKYEDANGNGQIDPGEERLGGWRIQVRDLFGELVCDTQTVSDAGRADYGHWYLNTQLPAGVYTIEEVPQEGWVQTAPKTWDTRYWIYWFGDGTFRLLGPTPVAFQRFDFANAQPTATPTPVTATATPTPSPTVMPLPYRFWLPLVLKS